MKTQQSENQNGSSHPSIETDYEGMGLESPEFSLQSSGGFSTEPMQMAKKKDTKKPAKKFNSGFKNGIPPKSGQKKREKKIEEIRKRKKWERLAKRKTLGLFEQVHEQKPSFFEETDEEMMDITFEPNEKEINPSVEDFLNNSKSKQSINKVKGEYFEDATRETFDLDGISYVDLNEFKPNCPGLDHLGDTLRPFEQDKAHTSGSMDDMVKDYEGEIDSRDDHAKKFLQGFKDPKQKTYKGMMNGLLNAQSRFENNDKITEVINGINHTHKMNKKDGMSSFMPHEDEDLVKTVSNNMSYNVPYDVWEEMTVKSDDFKTDKKFFEESEKNKDMEPEEFLKSFYENNPMKEDSYPYLQYANPSEIASWELNDHMQELLEEDKIKNVKPRKKKTEKDKDPDFEL